MMVTYNEVDLVRRVDRISSRLTMGGCARNAEQATFIRSYCEHGDRAQRRMPIHCPKISDFLTDRHFDL